VCRLGQACTSTTLPQLCSTNPFSCTPQCHHQGGGGGACLTKTTHTIIVGTWLQEKGQSASNCNAAVEKLGEYLREKGF